MSNTKFAIALDHMKNDEFDMVYWPTVELALRIADKLMQDTSITGEIVRDAMLKEIDL